MYCILLHGIYDLCKVQTSKFKQQENFWALLRYQYWYKWPKKVPNIVASISPTSANFEDIHNLPINRSSNLPIISPRRASSGSILWRSSLRVVARWRTGSTSRRVLGALHGRKARIRWWTVFCQNRSAHRRWERLEAFWRKSWENIKLRLAKLYYHFPCDSNLKTALFLASTAYVVVFHNAKTIQSSQYHAQWYIKTYMQYIS